MIMAEKDAVLPPAMADGDGRTSSPTWRTSWCRVLDTGPSRKKPEEVNRLMLDWLERRVPDMTRACPGDGTGDTHARGVPA